MNAVVNAAVIALALLGVVFLVALCIVGIAVAIWHAIAPPRKRGMPIAPISRLPEKKP